MKKEERAMLADILMALKQQQSTLASVMNQIAALRDVLKEASPQFSQLFSARLEYWQNLTAAGVQETNATYDASILKLLNTPVDS